MVSGIGAMVQSEFRGSGSPRRAPSCGCVRNSPVPDSRLTYALIVALSAFLRWSVLQQRREAQDSDGMPERADFMVASFCSSLRVVASYNLEPKLRLFSMSALVAATRRMPECSRNTISQIGTALVFTSGPCGTMCEHVHVAFVDNARNAVWHRCCPELVGTLFAVGGR